MAFAVYHPSPYVSLQPFSASQTTSVGGSNRATSSGSQQSTSTQRSTSAQQASNISESSTYIPEYSQTPILEGIAKYAHQMAPQVYEWGMDQFNKNQGNIDSMMRDSMSYASPQRIKQEMGMAQSGVMMGAEAGRQNAERDLQGMGIDPSSGRYAALNNASQVMAGASAAGAGNQQRMATEAQGSAMRNAATSASLQNQQIGYGASNAMNQLLGTGMQLQYSPLGTRSYSAGQSSAENTSATDTQSSATNASNSYGTGPSSFGSSSSGMKEQIVNQWAEGGDVPEELSRSDGQVQDDVPANLTAGEFIIPKDVVDWKGKEFFYKLMAQARKIRATSDGEQHMGYGAG